MSQDMGGTLRFEQHLQLKINLRKVVWQVAPSSHSGYKPFQVYAVPFARKSHHAGVAYRIAATVVVRGALALRGHGSGEVSTGTWMQSKCSKPVKRGLSG